MSSHPDNKDAAGKAAAHATPAPSRLGVWFAHHLHSVVFSLGRALRKPWATVLTVAVMALALALPGMLLLPKVAPWGADDGDGNGELAPSAPH